MNTLMQELSTAKTYEHNRLNKTSVVDRVNPITVGNFVFLFNCSRWVGLQTVRRFRLKDLSVDEMVGA